MGRKPPRILVEWICSECNAIHRISFPYILKSVRGRIRVKWKEKNIKKLEIDYLTTLKELNNFLNFLFYRRFKAINYIEISYPKELLSLLEENEQKKLNSTN